MKRNVAVLLTALPPTLGHRDLVRFAAALPDSRVWVLICSRSFEPYGGEQRLAAVSAAFAGDSRVTVRLRKDDLAPQNPPDHPTFWEWWRDAVNGAFPEVGGEWSYFVASESYGQPMAAILGAEFLPYDIGRARNPSRASAVRTDLWGEWDSLLPEARRDFQVRAVLFGPESVGKTTVSRAVAARLRADWLPEYARPYLEEVGPECDLRSMEAIHAGQRSIQANAYEEALRPVLVMDTDLYTTIGYYPLMDAPAPESIRRDAAELVADRYYLLSDQAPFEVDPLRYGGSQRESDSSYWESLLRREGLPYLAVPSGSVREEADFIAEDIRRLFQDRTDALRNFVRE